MTPASRGGSATSVSCPRRRGDPWQTSRKQGKGRQGCGTVSGQSPTRAPGPTAGGPRHSSTQRWHGGDGPQLLLRPPLVAVKGRSQRGCSLRARSRAEAGRGPEHPQPQPRFASPPERFSHPLFPQISPHRALGAPSHAKVPHPGTLLSQSQQLRGRSVRSLQLRTEEAAVYPRGPHGGPVQALSPHGSSWASMPVTSAGAAQTRVCDLWGGTG